MATAQDKARLLVQLSCPCCGEVRIDKRLLPAILKIEKKLGIRAQVNSGYRCPAHNTELVVQWVLEALAYEKAHPDKKYPKPKPSKTSTHCLGLAIDLQCHKSRQEELIAYAKTIGFKGIGRGRRMVHLDMRDIPAEWTYP